MSARQSKRRAAPTPKALAFAREQQQSREASRAKDRVGFRAFGNLHARAVLDFAGEEPPDDDTSSSSEDEVVECSRPGPQPKRSKKPAKRNNTTKWSVRADLTLATIGLKHEVWSVPGSTLSVTEKWENCHADLSEEPNVRIFGSRKKSAIEAHFVYLVSNESKNNSKAIKESGVGTAESGSEDECEKRDRSQLEKVLLAIVDAKSAAKQDRTETKRKKATIAARNTKIGHLAVSQSNARCGPGAKATSFVEARASDERAFAELQGDGGDGVAGTRAGGAGGDHVDRSSLPIAGGTRTVHPALGSKLARDMDAPTIAQLATLAGATREEVDRVLNAGCSLDEVSRDKAESIFETLIKGKLSARRFGKSVAEFVAACAEEDDGDYGEVPGMNGILFSELCSHYRFDENRFYGTSDAAHYFINGWPLSENPTDQKVTLQTTRLASMLVSGLDCTQRIDHTDIKGSSAASNMGPSRQANPGTGNRGRKSRNSSRKEQEDGLDGFMQEQMNMAENFAKQKRMDDDRKAARRREEFHLQLANERGIRRDERIEDRQERAKEREENRLELAATRAHELKLMELQVQLAKAKSNS